MCEKVGVPFEEVVDVVPDRLMQDSQYLLDSSLITQDLGWSPTIDLDEGLEDTVKWVRDHLDVVKGLLIVFSFER